MELGSNDVERDGNDMELKTIVHSAALSLAVFAVACFGQSAGITNVTVSFSATPTFTVNGGVTNFDLTLTGNVTSSTFSAAANAVGSIKICQDSSGGHTLVWPGGALGFGTPTTTANLCSRQPYKWDGSVLQATGLMVPDSGIAQAVNGGTGNGSYTIGDMLYSTGSGTLSRLAGVATGNALISGGVATAPSWGKIALPTHISGVLPVANGGTNTSTAPSSAQILVATNSTTYAPVTMSGDATISSAGVVTLTAPLKVWSKDITIFDPVTGDSGRVQFRLPFAGTITSVACAVKAATSATINFDVRAIATPDTGGTAVLTSGLACDVDSAVSTTFSSTAVAADVPVALTISVVSGTPDTLRVTIKGTIN